MFQSASVYMLVYMLVLVESLIKNNRISNSINMRKKTVFVCVLTHMFVLKYFACSHWFYHPYTIVLFLKMSYFSKNTRHVCTYLNAFLMVIINIVMKFNYFDNFGNFLNF